MRNSALARCLQRSNYSSIRSTSSPFSSYTSLPRVVSHAFFLLPPHYLCGILPFLKCFQLCAVEALLWNWLEPAVCGTEQHLVPPHRAHSAAPPAANTLQVNPTQCSQILHSCQEKVMTLGIFTNILIQLWDRSLVLKDSSSSAQF